MTTPWEAYQRALQEAQLWCQARIDLNHPDTCLRSAELRPPDYPERWGWGELHPEWVQNLIDQRSALLEGLPPQQVSGRILCFQGQLELAMGEGEPASKGVIDDNYLPPWDTWFAFLSHLPKARLLLAWIPEALSEWVQGAIEVGANHPIEWLDVVVTAEDLQPGDGWHEIQGELRSIWQHLAASNSS